MPFELPTPPPGTHFRRDYDGVGRLRLTWPSRITGRHCFRAAAIAVGWCAILYFLLWGINYEIDYSPDGPLGERIWTQLRRGNGKLLGLSFIFLILLLLLLVGIRLFVRGLLYAKGTVRHTLTFDADVLRYRGKATRSFGSDGVEVVRSAIRAVGAPRGGGLLIAAGTAQFEIDPTLTRRERGWLADVIRDWAGLVQPVAPPDIPPLPAESWLQLDHDPNGYPCLSWLPPEELCLAGGRMVGRRALAWLPGWIIAEGSLLALLGYLLLGNPNWLAFYLWLAGVALGLSLLICTSAGLAILAELVSLGRRARPESITLGPARLHHDPGHCYCGDAFSLGTPQDMERAEIARILLQDGPHARVELQLHGGVTRSRPHPEERRQTGGPAVPAEPIVRYRTVRVGSCLRSFERAWLADTLRWWAGLPSDEP